MKASKKEFLGYLNDLSSFPLSFVYRDVYFHGFPSAAFKLVSHDVTTKGPKEDHIFIFSFCDIIKVTLETAYYDGYDAFDWTVYFENTSDTVETGVLRLINSADYSLEGGNPVLKGILGDHENNYAPYADDLKEGDVNFRNDLGRSCHRYFPYFNLENDDGGALIALGWGGTWEANFTYDASRNLSTYRGQGVIDFASYLKPGEKIRTPLNAVVRYYVRDEDAATNKWRKWFIDCNMPKDHSGSDEVVQPKSCVVLSNDTGKPNSDGSISEDYTTWQPSLDKIIDEGVQADLEWFDAGWYQAPDGSSPTSDWWGTVGTWLMDPKKWPSDTFAQRSDYASEHGMKTMVWFEPERVTEPTYLVSRLGYNMDWILSDYGNNNCFVNNLGNPDCLAWTEKRVLGAIKNYHISIYREDFNIDPYIFFTIGDGYQGKNRTGITENLYYQGHYKLLDDIIALTSENGGASFVDSCASGGGRNDLESARRSVPFLRSDSDRTTIALRLAYTHSLNQWLPFTGTDCKESGSQVTSGAFDQYILRASYLGVMTFDYEWTLDPTLDYSLLKSCQKEWDDMKWLLSKDFYNLTPYHTISDDTGFAAYEYFDPESDKGLIQAFRQADCEDPTVEIKVKGLQDNKYYSLTDLEGVNSLARVSGARLAEGYLVRLNNKRSSAMIYINPVS
jgi:alpha-galactosidase